MRILEVNKYYHPVAGGIEAHVRAIARGLADDHAVRVLAARGSPGFGTRRTVDGVPVRLAGSVGEALSVPLAPAFPVALASETRRADVVHYHLPNPLAVCAALAAPTWGRQTVVTYHSDVVRQRRSFRLYRPALYRFLGAADRILVTSPRLLEHSPHLSRFEDRCTVVPLSTDPEVPPAGSGDGGEGPGADQRGADDDAPAAVVDPDDDVVLFVGRLVYYKGVSHLVEAMADVDATLVVVGEGERRGAAERRARELGIDDRVAFVGRVDDATLHRWYERADVFVLPSVARSEAFGIVQLEAMAHGTPVVNTDLPTGVPWVSPDGETGVTVPPGDPDRLAAAIRDLLADPDRRRELGENGRRRVRDRFAHDEVTARIEGIFRELVEGA